MLRAVLDANVVVSAPLRPEGAPGKIIELLVAERAFELVTSRDIMAEVRRSVRYPRVRRYLRLSDEELELRLTMLELIADSVQGTRSILAVAADPDDDKYVVAAVEGRAQYIVSGDRHLLNLGEYEGIRIVTPREVLAFLKR